MTALKGITVLSTRPGDDVDALGILLRAQGARVLQAPMIRFAPPEDPAALPAVLARASTYRAVILTSPRAVRAVVGGLAGGVPVVTLGARTRADARAAGLDVEPVRDAVDGADLAEAMATALQV